MRGNSEPIQLLPMRIYRLLSTISLGSLSEKGMVTLTIADDVINEKYVCLRVN